MLFLTEEDELRTKILIITYSLFREMLVGTNPNVTYIRTKKQIEQSRKDYEKHREIVEDIIFGKTKE